MTKSESILLRMPPELLERIDEYVAVMSEQYPGFGINRSAAVRQFVIEGLDRAGIGESGAKTRKRSD